MSAIQRFRITYDDILEIMKLAAEGQPLTKICEQVGISKLALTKLRKKDACFAKSLDLARTAGLEMLADGLIDIHERIDCPIKARIASENHRWLLSKRIPKTYGDRIDVNVTQTIDVKGVRQAALQRAGIDSVKVIDVNTRSDEEPDYLGVDISVGDDDDIFS